MSDGRTHAGASNAYIALEIVWLGTPLTIALTHLNRTGPGWVRLPLPPVGGADVELLPGHVQAVLAVGAPEIEFLSIQGRFDTLRLVGQAGASVRLGFNLFWKTTQNRSIGIPLSVEGGGKFAFGAEMVAEAEAQLFSWKEAGVETSRLTMLENAVGWSAPEIPVALAALKEVVGFADRPLLSGTKELTSVIKSIKLEHPKVSLEEGALKLSELRGTIEFAEGRTLSLGGAEFYLDRDFHLRVSGDPQLTFTLAKDELLLRGNGSRAPLSIRFAAGTAFTFSLDPRDPYVAMSGAAEAPAMVYVPGLLAADLEAAGPNGEIKPTAKALGERFVLSFAGDVPGKSLCRITPHGAQMTALAEPRAIQLGEKGVLRDVQLEQGRLTLDRGDYDLDIAASARLGFFERVSGRLTVRANSRANDQKFAARFDVQIEGAWEDPTGSIEFRDPGAGVEIALGAASGWDVRAFISGTVRFKAVERWLSGAADWLGELVDDLAVRFDRMELHTFLEDLAKDPFKHITLKIQGGGKQLKLWSILRFEVTEFGLGRDSIVLAGKVHFTLEGGFYFMGGIPRMRISLKDGIDLVDDPGQPMTLTGKLVTPTGISAEIELIREKTATRQRLAGHGALLIPGWPGFHITCGFGRRRPDPQQDRWIATLFLFVEADFPITIFPCVVLREMGLGFGINQKLRGFDRLWVSDNAFDNLMKDPRGLPNPAAPADWEDGGGLGFTDIALVARTHVAPSPQGRGPFPYVADAMLYIQPTSEFTIAFTSNLWLFTGLDDVRSPAYRGAPLVQTLIVMYPRHGHLEARSRTRRDSKMSAAPDAVAKALSIVETEMLLKATPDMFRLRVGLMQVQLKLAGFDLRGSLLYGVEAGRGVALMLMQQQMSGAFDLDWRFGVQLGPLRIEVGLEIHARMAYSLLLAGGYFGAGLGILFYGLARVHISISMSVSLALRFYLRIKIGWFKITISWSMRLSASLAIAFDAEVEALLGTSGMALCGEGTLSFRCCGFSFNPRISFSVGNSDRLEQVRARLRPFLPPNQNALN